MILIVDDDHRRIASYLDELAIAGLDYSFQADVDSATSFFDKNRERISLLIVDVVMPTGHFSLEETKRGWRTGVIFYEWVRSKTPDLPVVILTNVVGPLPSNLSEDRHCRIKRKAHLMPYELVELVEEMQDRR